MRIFGSNASGGGQRGVVLFMTLIALVAMTLAAIALMRSVDTGNLVAGNVALKQGAAQEADKAMNLAYECLNTGGAVAVTKNFGANLTACNYYASIQADTLPPYGVPDVIESAPVMVDDTATTGNTITFVIERLCKNAGTWSEATCTSSPFGKAATGGDVREFKLRTFQGMYRISVKVSGPRNVASYTQAMITGGM